MSRFALVIDEEACWGCKTCEVACSQEYEFRSKFMFVTEEGPTPGGAMDDYQYRVGVCKHCDDPPCVDACPEQAISKRDDGIVLLDYDACTGCRNCIDACPFDAIAFDDEHQTALKCNMCHHRVDNGLIPACADNACLAHCIYFGNPSTVQEEIDRKRGKRQTR